MSELIDRQAVRLAKVPYDEQLSEYERGWNDACEAIADNVPSAPRWVRCEEELPKKNDTVLVRDCGYRVLTYLGDGRWEDDYGYGAEFVSDDAEWCYIEPPQEVQE